MIEKLDSYPSYRETHTEWLGKIPSHWETPRLGSVLEERRETNANGMVSDVLSVLRNVGVIPYEEKGNIGNKKSEDITRYKVVRPNDIVVNCMNVIIGSVGLSKYTGCLSPVYYVLRPRSARNSPAYLNYIFQTSAFQHNLTRLGNGILAHRMRIPMELLKCESLPLPPPDEQAAIVRFLDHAERRIRRYIRAKRQLISLLNEQKQAIIHQAVTRGLDPNVKLKPSGVEWLGDVPEHWEVRRNGYLFAERKEIGNPALPLLVVSLRTGVTIGDEVDENGRPKRLIEDRQNYRTARKGDIAYNMMRLWQGAVGVAPVDGLVSPAYVTAAPATKVATKYYELLFRTAEYKAEVNRCSTGIVSDRNRCYWDDFKQLLSPVPPYEEQLSIVDHLDRQVRAIDKAIEDAELEGSLMREYRVRLIADAVTGKFDVRDAAAQLTDDAAESQNPTDDLLEDGEVVDDAELDIEPEEVEA